MGNDTSLGFNLIGRDVSASDALDKVARKAKATGADFDVVGKNLGGFTSSVTKGFLGVGAAIGGAFAVGNVVSAFTDYMRDAASAAMEDQKSMVALATAMDNVGQGFANAGAEDFVRSLMLATGTADDQLRPALQRLVTATGDAEQSQKLLTLALDISAATGKDVVTVSQALGKAANGQVSALTRLGVPLDANIVKTKDFGAAVEVLNEKFGGQAAAAADTYAGQMKRVQTAAAEAQETIGYALLGAIEDVSDAFGFGADGATGLVTAFGDATANFVTGAGQMVAALAGLTASMNANQQESTDWGDNIRNIIIRTVPWFATTALAYEQMTDAGERSAAADKAKADELAGITALYAGYKANSDRAHSSTVAMTQAAEDEADALQEVSDAVKELQGLLSSSQSMDDFRKSLADLDKTLDKNTRSFKGMGDGAKENRDTLRSALGDAAKIAQQWVEDGKITADQYEAAYKGLAKKVVNQYVKDGFKRSDIEAFLGGEGIWTGPITKTLTAVERQALAQAGAVGRGIGRDLGLGTVKGMAGTSAAVQAQAQRLIREAEAAARAAAESHSPSQLFYRVGEDLGAGLQQGMAIVWPRIAGDINRGMDVLTISIRGKADEASGEMLKSFASRTEAFKAVIDAQVEKITTARQALDDYAASVTSTILGNVKFQTTGTGADGKSVALTPEQIVQMVLGDIANQTNAVNAIAQIATKIPEALAQQMLTMDPKAAIELANYLAARPEQAAQLTANYQALATLTQTTLGIPMAQTFATVGDVSAAKMIDSAKARIREEAAEFRRWVRSHLATEITVKVNYDTSSAPVGARATGGPVTGGLPYLVGEKGPELFVPGASGSIVPNGALTALPVGGGGNVVVNVNVGGSVVREQDLAVTVRDQIAQMMRRRGLNPAVIGA